MGEYTDVWLSLDKETFASIEKRANQESIDSDENDPDLKKDLLFPSAEIRTGEMCIEDNSDVLTLSGELHSFGKELGFITLSIPLNQDIAVQIIDRYMKKLGKLKTVLEATKD